MLAIASIVSLLSDLTTSEKLKWCKVIQAILAIQLFSYKNGLSCSAIWAIQLFSLFKAHDKNLKLFWLFIHIEMVYHAQLFWLFSSFHIHASFKKLFWLFSSFHIKMNCHVQLFWLFSYFQNLNHMIRISSYFGSLALFTFHASLMKLFWLFSSFHIKMV